MWKHICREQRETLSIPDVSDIAIKIKKGGAIARFGDGSAFLL